ncbi:MAG TPA: PilC/PilY family type IV pilus protein [Burkholderiaceae bacterium]|nr:PilC/PilY family type IV pilus protein [Burkholderiaceae bacterium]
MKYLVFLLLSVCLCVHAAPPLAVPHGRLGEPVAGEGLAAVWRPAGGVAFVLTTRFDVPGANGSLQRHALTLSRDGGGVMAERTDWDAAQLLTGDSARRIQTMNERGQTIPFSWDALDAGWRNWLDVPQFEAAPDGLGEARLAYLRGERATEGKQFRQRRALLGDALHSAPLIVGPPSAFEQGAAYAAFRARYRTRPVVAYLGTNDGMLHAFDTDSGAEWFAYVPRVLGPRLAALASPSYVPRPYVDGSAGQGDALAGGQWRTVLASGMGMGARGLFALDITEPGRFGGLWEFTERDDPAIGHLRGAPLVTRIRTGMLRQQAQYGSVVVAASGINPLDGGSDGALFVLDVGKPPAQPWQAGVNYFRIATAGTDPALANALGPPALALRPDGSASLAYAGDLQGNLWRFDLTGRQAVKVFTAQDREGQTQPIAHAPAVVFAPGGGYLVLFSTGRMLESTDLLKASFTPQSMYAILDRPDLAALPPATRKQLARRALAGKDSFTIKGAAFDYGARDAKRGWYFDFPDATADGERSAGSPVALAGAIVFDTILPGTGVPPARRSYVVDALSGFALDSAGVAAPGAATGTLLPAGTPGPLLMASGVDAGAREPTGGVTVVRSFTLLRPGAGPGTVIRVRRLAGRLAWREVANWQELHARTKEKK